MYLRASKQGLPYVGRSNHYDTSNIALVLLSLVKYVHLDCDKRFLLIANTLNRHYYFELLKQASEVLKLLKV